MPHGRRRSYARTGTRRRQQEASGTAREVLPRKEVGSGAPRRNTTQRVLRHVGDERSPPAQVPPLVSAQARTAHRTSFDGPYAL